MQSIVFLLVITIALASQLGLRADTCIASGCTCGTATTQLASCRSDAIQQCYQKYGNCRSVKGQCLWDYSTSKLRECLDTAGYCRKVGCGLEICQVDDGTVIGFTCAVVPTFKKCFENAHCKIRDSGVCGYNKKSRPLLRCLKANGGPNQIP